MKRALLCLLVLAACGSEKAPTAPEPDPWAFLATSTLVATVNGETVSWTFDGEDYRFSQVHSEVGERAWEEGHWWMGVDFDGREAIVFQRLEGGALSRNMTWSELLPTTRPFTVIRLRDWIGLRTAGGQFIFYEVRPR